LEVKEAMTDARAEVETARLLLRPWTDEYTDDLVRLFRDPRVARNITRRGRPAKPESARRSSLRAQRLWEEYGFGPWAALDKESRDWIGRIGLTLLEDWPGPDKWALEGELHPVFWGRGLAIEGGQAALRFGFDVAELPRIIAVTRPTNVPARRAAERCGLRFQGTVNWRDRDFVWYTADRQGIPFLPGLI
jgi:ribosomal-protein-alanine N-acetyltransferase